MNIFLKKIYTNGQQALKKCLAPLNIREMQIENQRYYLTFIKMAI